LTSHVWRQDHNGFSHQDPGFIDHVVNKKADVIRVYLPPDANTLLWVTDHCLRSWNRIHVIVAGKQPQPQWLDIDSAIKHCDAGIGIWEWASNDRGGEPDVVMDCAGDVPTIETLAAGRSVAPSRLRPQDPRCQRHRPDDPATARGASARPHQPRFRCAVHHRQADRLRLSGLSLADPPFDLPANQPRQPSRPRLQGRGNDNDGVRHGRAQRPRPLSPFQRRDRSRAQARLPRRLRQASDARQADRAQGLHQREPPEVKEWRWSAPNG
jgi:hypothetical protein